MPYGVQLVSVESPFGGDRAHGGVRDDSRTVDAVRPLPQLAARPRSAGSAVSTPPVSCAGAPPVPDRARGRKRT